MGNNRVFVLNSFDFKFVWDWVLFGVELIKKFIVGRCGEYYGCIRENYFFVFYCLCNSKGLR